MQVAMQVVTTGILNDTIVILVEDEGVVAISSLLPLSRAGGSEAATITNYAHSFSFPA